MRSFCGAIYVVKFKSLLGTTLHAFTTVLLYKSEPSAAVVAALTLPLLFLVFIWHAPSSKGYSRAVLEAPPGSYGAHVLLCASTILKFSLQAACYLMCSVSSKSIQMPSSSTLLNESCWMKMTSLALTMMNRVRFVHTTPFSVYLQKS